MKYLSLTLVLLALFTFGSAANINLKQLTVPAGFKIEFFAENVENARQMALSPSGIVYVGSRKAGKVYALKDVDSDGKVDQRWLVAEDLNMPSGLAFKEDDLYVADVDKILKFTNIDANLEQPVIELFFNDLPDDDHHGWKFIRFAPNGDLIIPVGAPCNICEAPTDKHARILALDMNTKTLTELAKGVRNTVGFDYHPLTNQLWFSDNGRDMMSDDVPGDEINRLIDVGSHFGYPYFHAGDVADPEFSKGKKSSDYIFPEYTLGAHVAPLGVHFYRGQQFPKSYKNQLFVAEHGSWNRTKKSGYKVALLTIENSKVVNYQAFISGFMQAEKTFGRPVAILELADGSLLVSDDFANVIYRISYQDSM